jgi:hypothetical protein
MSLDHFLQPITEAARTHFLTATAVARRMIEQGKGVIMMLSSSAARESGFEMGGFSLACASIECFPRSLAGDRQTRCPGGVAAAEFHAGDLAGAGGSGIGRPTGPDHRYGAGPAAAPRRSRGDGSLHGLRPRRSDDRSGRQPDLWRDSGLERFASARLPGSLELGHPSD